MATLKLSEKVQAKLSDLPDRPGCYLMRDRRGKIIYVGKALSLRKRVQSYFREGTWRRADPKLRGLVRSVDDFDILVLRNEAEALLTESRLIKDYKPRYNVDFKDDKRFLMLRIDLKEPWPMFKAVRIRRDDGAVYLGPYISSAATYAAMAFVEKKFGLRKCKPREPGPADHRHCINDIVRFCTAPCVGRIDREAYLERAGGACAFLRGERPALLEEVRAAMEQAAKASRFEEAASLRDTWFMLRDIVHQRARAAMPVMNRQEDAKAGLCELRQALHLAAVPKVIECYDISNISGTLAVASLVCLVEGRPSPSRYRHFKIRTIEQADDPGMMAEVIRRRFRRAREAGEAFPDLVIVDGGIPQLNAASGALLEIGVNGQAVIGLAKRFEEVHLPGQREPVRLPPGSSALHLLQRARDEAHRFALGHHRRMRARRIRESAIDEIPGIGKQRKKDLLLHFGSVRRLLRASPDEIAGVAGVGPKLAEQVARWVRTQTD
jgi:excinuclease ABC subunit C